MKDKEGKEIMEGEMVDMAMFGKCIVLSTNPSEGSVRMYCVRDSTFIVLWPEQDENGETACWTYYVENQPAHTRHYRHYYMKGPSTWTALLAAARG